MEEEKQAEFEIEKIIPVNIIEDKKQMRIGIPAEIIDEFGIDPNRNKFAWVVQKQKNSNQINITGRFIIKQNGKKKII